MSEPPPRWHEWAAGECRILVEDRVIIANEVDDAMLADALIELEIDGDRARIRFGEIVLTGHGAFDVHAVAARAVKQRGVQRDGRGNDHGDLFAAPIERANC